MGNIFDTAKKDAIVRESKVVELKSMVEIKEALDPPDNFQPLVKSMVEIKEALDPPDNLPPIYLPTDILINIFSRLSVKILCSCKCVSKEWHQVISSNQHFMESHRIFSLKNPVLLFTYHYHSKKNTDEHTISLHCSHVNGMFYSHFTKDDHFYSYSFLSCAGLICMFRLNSSFSIINPSIQEFLQLPKHCGQSNEQSVGFGFLESRKEYRIASLLSRPNSDDTELWCEIFYLKEGEGNSGSWRDAGKCPFRIFEISSPACVNGVIYWLARDKDHLDNKILMISLDLEQEKFSSVRYPDHISSLDFLEFSLDQLSLVELKGCLCLVDNSSENLITDVWTLKDAKNQTWFKEYSIALGTLDDSITVCCNPMDVRDGEILLEASPGDEGRQGRLYFYNIEKKTFRTTEDIAGDWLSGLYFETFFSLRSRRQI
ncbi:hypothetical protein RJ640_007738 [Escallonia rubra]|uniref:F-box domain-containing protein n=1 Tax=Escallonia rubra TaxID=112253 RepID=A0AA88U5T5_9ASTE|nr:hypothetical protein RJ640_007738 [Escallonia rubra]